MNENLPRFLKEKPVEDVLRELAELAPKTHGIYLHGGALRNSIYYHFFQEDQPQRDFDLIVIGEKDPFVNILLKNGFLLGKKNTPEAVVLKKARKKDASEDWDDWVVLDVVFRKDISIDDVLKEKVNFTINGSAIELKHIFEQDWFDRIITLPTALRDLQSKQIRTNTRYPINIYACIRFVSRGYNPPSRQEINDMVEDLKQVDEEKFKYNADKVISYVGNEDKVKSIASQLGVPFDILDFKSIKNQD